MRRAGRIFFPWLFVVGVFLASFVFVKVRQLAEPPLWEKVQTTALDVRTPSLVVVDAWAGESVLPDGRRLVAELLPYHLDADFQRVRSGHLRARLGLGEGELWRLRVTLLDVDRAKAGSGEPSADEKIPLDSARGRDEDGLALMTLAMAAARFQGRDPLLTALTTGDVVLEVGASSYLALWGRQPRKGLKLSLSSAERSITLVLEPARLDAAGVPRWFRESPLAARPAGADAPGPEIAALRAELERERTRRRERELEWLDFIQTLGKLDLGAVAGGSFALDPALAAERGSSDPASDSTGRSSEEEAVSEEEAPDPARARAGSIAVALRTLFRVEGLRGLDLLEAGALGDGWVGPVVFRVLDDRGRLTGSVFAERLRMEASRTARTLTIVLEEGHESTGGENVPFASGARRIVLPFVDPEPWVESVPELFAAADVQPPNDDGVWYLPTVRRELNRLLAQDAAAGWYRLHSLGGVLGDELVDVQLEEYDETGRLRRRYFADRMRIRLEEPGIQLVLEGGAIVRGEDKEAFRGGVQRIYLPRAHRDEWEAAPLPGLGEPPVASARPRAPGSSVDPQGDGSDEEGGR